MPTPKLLGALLAVQEEAPTLAKDATNPHFRSKYTPLDTIVQTMQPILTRHGLTWATFPTRDEHGPALRYVLSHAESGEQMEDTMPLLLSKSDPQGQGSAITYARRYAMCAVLNLVADEDDDGNAGSGGQSKAKKAPGKTTPAKKPEPATKATIGKPTPIASEVLDKLRAQFEKSGWSEDKLKWALVDVGADPNAGLKVAMAALSLDQAVKLMESMGGFVDDLA